MTRKPLIEEELTYSVIGAFYEVYNTLGFGFLEHIYVMALERELLARGHKVAREVGVTVMYKGHELGTQRLDMMSTKSSSSKRNRHMSFTKPHRAKYTAI